MKNEKRLIDANELLHNSVWLCGGFVGDPYSGGYMDALDKVETVIREFPTVDAVEVVRCKNCYHNERCICVCCEDGKMVLCGLHHKHMDANDYCSYGWKENNT